MRHKLFALLAFVLFSTMSWAQSSMTDDQVLKYLVTETQKGTSQQKMAADLLKKGVTTTQLQRVKKKAEKLQAEAQSGSKSSSKSKKSKV